MWQCVAMAEVLRHKLSEPLMKMIVLIIMMERDCANVINVTNVWALAEIYSVKNV